MRIEYKNDKLNFVIGDVRDFESINNAKTDDVNLNEKLQEWEQFYNFNRGAKILKQREEIKQKTILQRRINHLLQIQNQSLSFV